MNGNIACVIVLYKPSDGNIKNIYNTAKYFSDIVVVDNTIDVTYEDRIKKIINELGIKYVRNYNRGGVAGGFNLGIKKFLNDTKYALFLDQDTEIIADPVETIMRVINEIKLSNKETKTIGGISLNRKYKLFAPTNDTGQNGFRKCGPMQTSGMLMNLEVYKNIGGYDESLFIDEVDHDYCLRAIDRGYIFYETEKIFLYHELGDQKEYRFLFKKVVVHYHGAFRHYYMTRNLLLLCSRFYSRHKRYMLKRIMARIINVIKLVIYEDEKILKLKENLRGVYDGVKLLRKNRV